MSSNNSLVLVRQGRKVKVIITEYRHTNCACDVGCAPVWAQSATERLLLGSFKVAFNRRLATNFNWSFSRYGDCLHQCICANCLRRMRWCKQPRFRFKRSAKLCVQSAAWYYISITDKNRSVTDLIQRMRTNNTCTLSMQKSVSNFYYWRTETNDLIKILYT